MTEHETPQMGDVHMKLQPTEQLVMMVAQVTFEHPNVAEHPNPQAKVVAAHSMMEHAWAEHPYVTLPAPDPQECDPCEPCPPAPEPPPPCPEARSTTTLPPQPRD